MSKKVKTFVWIVCIMIILAAGLFFILKQSNQKSFNNIDIIDQNIVGQINSLLGSNTKAVIYPSGNIELKKGNSASGFGFSIRNIENEEGKFSYEILSKANDCGMSNSQAEGLIVLRKSESNINLKAKESMEYPLLIIFDIPKNNPLCSISYEIVIQKDERDYSAKNINVEIIE